MRQQMYCHDCGKDFSVDINMQADGNHVFKCPHCQHEHCRVVKNGEVTSERWDQRNGNIGAVHQCYTYVYSSGASCGSNSMVGNQFVNDSWASTSTATVYY